jgi:hypothetical protein
MANAKDACSTNAVGWRPWQGCGLPQRYGVATLHADLFGNAVSVDECAIGGTEVFEQGAICGCRQEAMPPGDATIGNDQIAF